MLVQLVWSAYQTRPEQVPDSTAPALGLLLQHFLRAQQQQVTSTLHLLGHKVWAIKAREKVFTDEGPCAGTWAMESQWGIRASRKEYVLVLSAAAGQPG